MKIAGPQGTAYEGGMFDAELYLPDEYPMVPPKVLFKSKIFHPNIDKLGKSTWHHYEPFHSSLLPIVHD